MAKYKTIFDAPWLNTPSPFDNLDDDLKKIIIFFVFHTPVVGVSVRGEKLAHFGWGVDDKQKLNDFNKLKKRLIDFSTMDKKSFTFVTNDNDMEQALKDNDLLTNFPSQLNKERLTFKKRDGTIGNMLRRLRNAFAHGRLCFHEINGEIVVVLEDIDQNRVVTGRMILKKTTLLRWIDIIQKGPKITDKELKELFGLEQPQCQN